MNKKKNYTELSEEDVDTISLIVKKYIEQGMKETDLISKLKTNEYEVTTQEIVDNVRKSFTENLDYLLNEYQQIMNYRNHVIKTFDMTVVNLGNTESVN